MKKFKDGKVIEASEEEVARVQKRFDKAKAPNQNNTNRASRHSLEARVKALEDAVAAILAEKNEEVKPDEN